MERNALEIKRIHFELLAEKEKSDIMITRIGTVNS